MISAIGHVAFRISDLDRSLEFFCSARSRSSVSFVIPEA